MYQIAGGVPPVVVSTLQGYAEQAIRRDLVRARAVLSGPGRIDPARRAALVDHVTWMAGLVQPGTAGVSPAAANVRDRALEYRPEGLGAERAEVVLALDGMERATAAVTGWTSSDIVRVALGNLPWVLDGVDARGGRGLVLPPRESAEVVRSRAAAYRQRRALLWGTVALHPAPVLCRSLDRR